MSEAILALDAESRADIGKGASRRLRRLENKVPAIVYGGKEAPKSISLPMNRLMQALAHESFYSRMLTLSIDGKAQKVVLKDLHRHHYKNSILHADFLRVSDTDVITMKIPLHFTNADKCPGAKLGGLITHQEIDVELRCKAKDLPEFIEVDLSNLQLDGAIHLSELNIPKSAEIAALIHGGKNADKAVVSVHAPKGSKTADIEEKAAEAAKEQEKK